MKINIFFLYTAAAVTLGCVASAAAYYYNSRNKVRHANESHAAVDRKIAVGYNNGVIQKLIEAGTILDAEINAAPPYNISILMACHNENYIFVSNKPQLVEHLFQLLSNNGSEDASQIQSHEEDDYTDNFGDVARQLMFSPKTL